MGWLGRTVSEHLTVEETVNMLSEEAVPPRIPAAMTEGPSSSASSRAFVGIVGTFTLAIRLGVQEYVTVVSPWVSLMTNGVDHLLMYLFAIIFF